MSTDELTDVAAAGGNTGFAVVVRTVSDTDLQQPSHIKAAQYVFRGSFNLKQNVIVINAHFNFKLVLFNVELLGPVTDLCYKGDCIKLGAAVIWGF